jgi:hypothetical protein
MFWMMTVARGIIGFGAGGMFNDLTDRDQH